MQALTCRPTAQPGLFVLGGNMPAFGYLTFLVRAGVAQRPHELYRLNEVGRGHEDLLTVVEDRLRGLGTRYHPVDKRAEGFRIKDVTRRGRTLSLIVNVGPAGLPGEAYDLDTGASSTTTERQALLSGLRALFVLPEDSYYGLLMVERVGRRHLRELLNEVVLKPAATTTASVIRIEAYAQIADWRRELSDMQVLRVSETLVRRDSGHDASTTRDTLVTVSAEGGVVARASDRLKAVFEGRLGRRDERLEAMRETSVLGERRRLAEDEGVAFADEGEYQEAVAAVQELNVPTTDDAELSDIIADTVPLNREELEHRQFQASLGVERPQRNIIIERDSIPQFIYELGQGRLLDTPLRNTWIAHAERILAALGVELPAAWSEGQRRR